MLKLNRGYVSLFEYLVNKNFPFIRWLDERLYSDENLRLANVASSNALQRKRWNPNPQFGEQILGGLQPMADIAKDIVDTFKPYKSAYHVKRDALQPLIGMGNIAKGVGNLFAAPLVLTINVFRHAFISGSFENYLDNTLINGYRTTSWLLDGGSSLVRGIAQIITAPLTWFIKMPLRGLITAIKGVPTLEQSQSMQHLVMNGEEAINKKLVLDLDCVRDELHRKFKKAIIRGQRTRIASNKEQDLYNAAYLKDGEHYVYPLSQDKAETALQYIGLFTKSIQEQKI